MHIKTSFFLRIHYTYPASPKGKKNTPSIIEEAMSSDEEFDPYNFDWSPMYRYRYPDNEVAFIFEKETAPELAASASASACFDEPAPDVLKVDPEKERAGLYADVNDLMGYDSSTWEARRIACAASSILVGISRPVVGDRPLTSSGIVFDYHGVKKILTSAYILGGDSISFSNTNVDVLLVNRKRVVGSICFMDQHYNVVIIDIPDDPMLRAAKFDSTSFELGTGVTALSRHSSGQLRGSSGQINVRNDHLTSDELMSSSCSISECGIGGPLIIKSSGLVIGMNLFSKSGFTPFMPSNVLLYCVQQLMSHGKVTIPWLGLKTRSVTELETDEVDLLYIKFNSTAGLVVKEVTKQSPADGSGICVGDVIISCNGCLVNSSSELVDILFQMVELPTSSKRRCKSAEFGILRVSDGTKYTKSVVISRTPAIINRWPLLPPLPPLPPQPKREVVSTSWFFDNDRLLAKSMLANY